MYVLNYASKMVIQHNSREEIEMSGTSLPTGQAGNPFEVEYLVTGKEADNHFN